VSFDEPLQPPEPQDGALTVDAIWMLPDAPAKAPVPSSIVPRITTLEGAERGYARRAAVDELE
jgi:hypothetical protein